MGSFLASDATGGVWRGSCGVKQRSEGQKQALSPLILQRGAGTRMRQAQGLGFLEAWCVPPFGCGALIRAPSWTGKGSSAPPSFDATALVLFEGLTSPSGRVCNQGVVGTPGLSPSSPLRSHSSSLGWRLSFFVEKDPRPVTLSAVVPFPASLASED